MKNHIVLNSFKGGSITQVVYGGHIIGVIKNKGNYFIGDAPKYGFTLRGDIKNNLAYEMVEKYKESHLGGKLK